MDARGGGCWAAACRNTLPAAAAALAYAVLLGWGLFTYAMLPRAVGELMVEKHGHAPHKAIRPTAHILGSVHVGRFTGARPLSMARLIFLFALAAQASARYTVVSSGTCDGAGYEYITSAAECAAAGTELGYTNGVHRMPRGTDDTADCQANRPRNCGVRTDTADSYLHYNARTSGACDGHTIHATCGIDGSVCICRFPSPPPSLQILNETQQLSRRRLNVVWPKMGKNGMILVIRQNI